MFRNNLVIGSFSPNYQITQLPIHHRYRQEGMHIFVNRVVGVIPISFKAAIATGRVEGTAGRVQVETVRALGLAAEEPEHGRVAHRIISRRCVPMLGRADC